MTNLYNEKMDKKLQKVKQKNADMKEFLSYVDTLAEKSKECCVVDSKFYEQYDVKRGLREENGKGVLVGLTNISGSISPVGLISCSTTCPAWPSSYFAGVAETHIICPTLASNSLKVSGLLSKADFNLKP